jgi:hypothetical protein
MPMLSLRRLESVDKQVELTWPIKLRIAIVSAVGMWQIGMLAWPMVAPAEPFGVVSIITGAISAGDAITLSAMAFGIGLVCYFLSWPYGSRIGILAAPAGLAIWAARSGDMGTLMQLNTSIVRREQIFSTLCWEPLLWLAIVAAGFFGVFVASHIIRPADTTPKTTTAGKPQKSGFGDIVYAVVAVIGSAVVAQFFIGIFARDFTILDAASGSVVAQPAIGQIIFAVVAAFIIAGFLIKKVLDLDYLWPIISSCLVTPFAIGTYGKHEVIESFAGRWPAVFFPNSVLAVLPIQVVAFGSIGAVIGYWIAVHYDYWRQHESADD